MADCFWFDDPSVLIDPDSMFEVWPLESCLSREEKYNAATRLILYMAAGAACYFQNAKALLLGLAFAGLIVLLYRRSNKKNDNLSMYGYDLPGYKPGPYDPKNNMLHRTPPPMRPHSHWVYHNSYDMHGAMRNPTPFGYNDTSQVNSAQNRFYPMFDDYMTRMMTTVDNIPLGLNTHPIPDQFKNVRQPTFHNEPEVGTRLGVGATDIYRWVR